MLQQAYPVGIGFKRGRMRRVGSEEVQVAPVFLIIVDSGGSPRAYPAWPFAWPSPSPVARANLPPRHTDITGAEMSVTGQFVSLDRAGLGAGVIAGGVPPSGLNAALPLTDRSVTDI